MTLKLKSIALALVMTSAFTISAVQASNEEIGGLDSKPTGLKPLQDQSAPINPEMIFQQLLNERNKEIEQLKIRNGKLEDELTTKNSQLDEKNYELELQRKSLERNQMVFTKQTEKFYDLNNTMNDLTRKKDEEIKKLNDALGKSKTCITEQDLQIFDLEFALKITKQFNEEKDKEIDDFIAQIKDLKGTQFQEKKKIVEKLTTEHYKEMDKMNTLLQMKEQKIHELEYEATNLRSKNSFLGRKIGDLFNRTKNAQFWLEPEFEYALTQVPEGQGQGQQNQGFQNWLGQQLPN